MEDRMRKARLLQSVAFLAGCMAVSLPPGQSTAQTTDSDTQRYDNYDYGNPGYPSYGTQYPPEYRESWDQSGSRDQDFDHRYTQSQMGRNYSQEGPGNQQGYGFYQQYGAYGG